MNYCLLFGIKHHFKMGRKGLFAEKPKKGPGRKAKKQGPPVLSRQFKGKIIIFTDYTMFYYKLFAFQWNLTLILYCIFSRKRE